MAIASYCDPALPRTLDRCLATARYPENLRFGLCWQFDTRQGIDLGRFTSDTRFRIAEYTYQESEGGSWARSLAQEFWNGEPYSLQVDSHMDFAPGWDMRLVHMMRTLPADKPLITMNAPLFQLDEKDCAHKHSYTCLRTTTLADWSGHMGWTPWFSWGVPRSKYPGRSRFVSGNFVFTLGAWTEDVRQDPQHYYWGEEFALTLRSYTHGYDLFLPDEIVAWHMMHPDAPPRRHWEHGEEVIAEKNRTAFKRFEWLAYSDDPEKQNKLGRYGLGRQRTRRDYERYAGMDLKQKAAHPDVYCGREPDPVTIKTNTEWADCITFEKYKNSTR